ncbi:MAG: 2-amino-4-oxopentanoate thiolase subunit OrtA [Bacillota bacterium]
MADRAGPQARPGDWVLIHNVVLPAGSRAHGVPPETQAVPLEMRVKGFLLEGPALPGETVSVRTLTGRVVRGSLVAVNPPIPHDFGSPVPELQTIGPELRRRLRGDRP